MGKRTRKWRERISNRETSASRRSGTWGRRLFNRLEFKTSKREMFETPASTSLNFNNFNTISTIMLPCTVSSTCPFCAIATAHPHESLLLTTPPPNPSAHSCTSSALPHLSATTSSSTSTSHTSPCTPTTTAPASSSYPGSPGTARVILSTPYLLAFLDHAPISRGHVLVATRAHREKLADISVAEGRALGSWLGIVSRAVMRAVASGEGNESGGDPSKADWNLVQNNGAQ